MSISDWLFKFSPERSYLLGKIVRLNSEKRELEERLANKDGAIQKAFNAGLSAGTFGGRWTRERVDMLKKALEERNV